MLGFLLWRVKMEIMNLFTRKPFDEPEDGDLNKKPSSKREIEVVKKKIEKEFEKSLKRNKIPFVKK